MKKTILCVAIAFVSGYFSAAQATLAGEISSKVQARFSEETDNDARFESALNPENLFQVRDISFDTELLLKLGAGDETTSLNVWIETDPYRIGEMLWLTTGATESPLDDLAATEAVTYLGDEIPAVRIMRADVTWFPASSLIIKLGRQNMLTGYGYGWNPIDFANPLKDPRDPDNELMGVDALTATWYAENLFSIRASILYRGQPLQDGIRYRDLQGGMELTGSLPQIEIKVTGFYEKDGEDEKEAKDAAGEDPFVNAVGIGGKVDIAGVGLYTEWAFLQGTRSLIPTKDLKLERETEWATSALIGLDYTFPFELSVAAEFFMNGEGLNRKERDLYLKSLKAATAFASAPTIAQLDVFRPGFFAEQYLLLYALYPLYDIQADVSLQSLYSPDSSALMILPEVVFRIGGNLNLSVGYAGLLNLDDKENSSEAELSPVRHSAVVEARYHF